MAHPSERITYRQRLVFRIVELVGAECCVEVLSGDKVWVARCVNFSGKGSAMIRERGL